MCDSRTARDASAAPLACAPALAVPRGPESCWSLSPRHCRVPAATIPPCLPVQPLGWQSSGPGAGHDCRSWALAEVRGFPRSRAACWVSSFPADDSGRHGGPSLCCSFGRGTVGKDRSCPTVSSYGSSQRLRVKSSCWPVCWGVSPGLRPLGHHRQDIWTLLCSLRKPLLPVNFNLSPCKPSSC